MGQTKGYMRLLFVAVLINGLFLVLISLNNFDLFFMYLIAACVPLGSFGYMGYFIVKQRNQKGIEPMFFRYFTVFFTIRLFVFIIYALIVYHLYLNYLLFLLLIYIFFFFMNLILEIIFVSIKNKWFDKEMST